MRRKFGEKCAKVTGAALPDLQQLLIDDIQKQLEAKVYDIIENSEKEQFWGAKSLISYRSIVNVLVRSA